MKWLNRLALFCIIFGTVLFISLVIFNHIIGGNADGGYRKEGVYMVYNEKQEEYIQVSKSVWYANYVYTQIAVFFFFLGCISAGYFYLMYICIPIWRKLKARKQEK